MIKLRTDFAVKRFPVAEMKLLDVGRRLERIERLLRAAADEARSARIDIGLDTGGNERWVRIGPLPVNGST